MSDVKLVHIQDDSFFLSSLGSQADYDIASNIRERLRDREDEVDLAYGPFQKREKERADQLRIDRKKTALEREAWLVVYDSKGNCHSIKSIDDELKLLMAEWTTRQYQIELAGNQKQNRMLREAQHKVKSEMLAQAAGDSELIKSIQGTPLLSAPPTAIKRQSNTTRNIEVTVENIHNINREYLQANLPKIKALAKSRGIEYALDDVGRYGVTIKETLTPRRKPRRR